MSSPLRPVDSEPSIVARGPDRRRGIGEVLTAVTRALEAGDPSQMRQAFEDALRRIVPARAIRLRDLAGRSAAREEPGSAESIAFDVPARDGGPPNVLEAAFDTSCPLGDWDFQVLEVAAQVAALVLDVERSRLQLVRAGMAGPVRPPRGVTTLVGSTPSMIALRVTVDRVACTDFTVLIQGESGVGKELVARQLHESSRRRAGPFVAINCAALVETLLEAELFGIEERTATGVRGRRGKFEHADGGTLFLDEVSDLSLSAQAKLLRVIQDLSVERVGGHAQRRVDVRIVAATNRSLADMVERKLFRADLYYRLSGVDIHVPPLRERRSDILELANHFLDRHQVARPLRLAPSACEALLAYDWPGNVRELERLVERAVALTESDVIALDDLPATVRGDYQIVLGASMARGESLRAWAGRYTRLVLERCGGNKREACRVLGISYHTLQAYLRMPPTELEPPGWLARDALPAAPSADEQAGPADP
jgi:DNA-binding NtrC family response regulator